MPECVLSPSSENIWMPRDSSQTIQFTRPSSNKNPENEKLPVQLNAGNSH